VNKIRHQVIKRELKKKGCLTNFLLKILFIQNGYIRVMVWETDVLEYITQEKLEIKKLIM